MKNKEIKNLENSLKNFYLGNDLNAKYVVEFESSNKRTFYINKEWIILSDQRYTFEMKRQIKDFIILDQNSLEDMKIFKDKIIKAIELEKTFWFDENISIKELESFKKLFKKWNLDNIAIKTYDKFDSIRLIKNEEEIKNTKIAIKETEKIFNFLEKKIKPGLSEIDVAKMIRIEISKSDAFKESFEAIVATGQNSSNPHWSPSTSIIKKGDFLTIDIGQFYKNVCSDMTRTFFIGDDEDLTKEMREVYEVVLEAKNLAISHIKPGMGAGELDKIVRDYLKKKGYEKYFVHSLGHGIGFEIHESPTLYKSENYILEEGNIITIEPGIYISGKFGVRIEDDILVTKNGYENLSSFKDYLVKIK